MKYIGKPIYTEAIVMLDVQSRKEWSLNLYIEEPFLSSITVR